MNAAANFAGIGCETSILSKQLNCGAGCQDLAKNSASRFQYNSFDKQLLIPHSLPFHERAAMSKTRISSGMGWGEEKKEGWNLLLSSKQLEARNFGFYFFGVLLLEQQYYDKESSSQPFCMRM